MEIIRTKKEQERFERNQAIMTEYCQLIRKYPGTKTWRILRTIGDKHDMTPEGVKLVLVSMGVYNEKQAV